MVKKRIPREIASSVKKYVSSLKKDNFTFEKVLLFGSWAKGVPHKYSDIDLCIVSSEFQKKDTWNYLWGKRRELGTIDIQPIGFAPEDFVDESPLAWEIKKHGIRGA